MTTLNPAAFAPHGGDHRSAVGRFGPLSADHYAVGRPCIICWAPLAVADVPTLISLAPADAEEAAKKAKGKPYDAIAGVAHELCAWPGSERDEPSATRPMGPSSGGFVGTTGGVC